MCALAVIAACGKDAAPPSPAAPPAPAPAPAKVTDAAVVTDATVVTTVDAAAAAATAGTPKPLEVVAWDGKPLPAGVSARGTIPERAVMFVDRNGTNYVVFSSTETNKPGGGPVMARQLFVDHWAVLANGKPRALLPARDQVSECEMGSVLAKFVAGAFGVTDLDHDGVAELTYGYQLACRSDVSPAVFKLLLVENGVKLILRGHTRIEASGDNPGGDFVPEPASATWPPEFFAHARALWNATADDLEIPPHR